MKKKYKVIFSLKMVKEDCEVNFGGYVGGSGNVDDNVICICWISDYFIINVNFLSNY